MSYEFWEQPGTHYVWMKSGYNADFVVGIKERVPHYERKWDSERKLWRFDKLAYPQVKRFCEFCVNMEGGTIIVHPSTPPWWVEDSSQEQSSGQREQKRSQWSNSSNNYSYTGGNRSGQQSNGHQSGGQRQGHGSSVGQSDPYSVLHLRESAPVEVIKSAYKSLAMLNHPDRGGDTETMKQINSAYDRLCKLRSIK